MQSGIKQNVSCDLSQGRSLILTASAGFILCLALITSLQLPGDHVAFEPEKINVNQAQIVSLQRLPGIGQVKAEAIVEFRAKNSDSADIVFRSAQDLTKIKGIGPKTVEKIERWIEFE